MFKPYHELETEPERSQNKVDDKVDDKHIWMQHLHPYSNFCIPIATVASSLQLLHPHCNGCIRSGTVGLSYSNVSSNVLLIDFPSSRVSKVSNILFRFNLKPYRIYNISFHEVDKVVSAMFHDPHAATSGSTASLFIQTLKRCI